MHAAQNLYVLADDSVTDAAATAAATANSAASQNGGAFGFLADGFEAFLKVQEHVLQAKTEM